LLIGNSFYFERSRHQLLSPMRELELLKSSICFTLL
jgi:hypothetical protein